MKFLLAVIIAYAAFAFAAPVADNYDLVRRRHSSGSVKNVDDHSGNHDSHDGDGDKGSCDGVDDCDGDSGTIIIHKRHEHKAGSGSVKDVDNHSGNGDSHDGDGDKGS